MIRQSVFHTPYGATAYETGAGRLLVKLRSARGDLNSVMVMYADRHMHPRVFQPLDMVRWGHDELFDYWQAEIVLETRRYSYYFILDDGANRLLYGEGGFAADVPEADLWRWSFQFAYGWGNDADEPPAWARDAVVYQIFPERFANGIQSNDPPGVRPWGLPPTPSSIFGGDLQGIIDHLGHLTELGINCLYLTPVFLSPSNHKYDTTDYYVIDPAFGDKEKARELVDQCHTRGIRVVLDAVFNHCGYDFAPFQDVVKRGALSPYASWFNVRQYPAEPGSYETFSTGVWRMPKLMTGHPEVQEYLIRVAEYWTRELAIDGWRLDVGDEIHPSFLRRLRQRVRAINPEALIMGEIMHDASPWLHGDQMDAVMNYPLQHLFSDFFASEGMDLAGFASECMRLRMRYRDSVNRASWNLLDSHDRPRFLTVCGGDRDTVKLASTVQFVQLGVPYIYYGDEIGLEGGDDPDSRRCMPWNRTEWDTDLLEHYQALIRLRLLHRVFADGEQAWAEADGNTGFGTMLRWTGDDTALVLLNASHTHFTASVTDLERRIRAAEVHGPIGRFDLAFSSRQFTGMPKTIDLAPASPGSVSVPPRTALVFVARR